jgi:hypothetical protein
MRTNADSSDSQSTGMKDATCRHVVGTTAAWEHDLHRVLNYGHGRVLKSGWIAQTPGIASVRN